MEKRICPNCRKWFQSDARVCPDCGARLSEVEPEFEAVIASMKEPVLLTNDCGGFSGYLDDALKERRISFYTEEGAILEYSYGGVKGGSVQPIPSVSYYVDRDDFEKAWEALEWAREQGRLDDEAPAVYLDLPEGWDEKEFDYENDLEAGDNTDEDTEEYSEQDSGFVDKQDTPANSDESSQSEALNLFQWYLNQDLGTRMVIGAVSGVFLLGFIAIVLGMM